MYITNSEARQRMGLNIIHHRQKFIDLLGNVSDPALRAEVKKIDPRNALDKKLIKKLINKSKPPIKVIDIEKITDPIKEEIIDPDGENLIDIVKDEILDSDEEEIMDLDEEKLMVSENLKCESSDDDNITVVTVSGWQNENETFVQTSRKPIRLNSFRKDVHHPTWNEELVNNMPYTVSIDTNQKKKRSKECSLVSEQHFHPVKKQYGNVSRFYSNYIKEIHNARERECRKTMAKLFEQLRHELITDSKMKFRSKARILLGAKNEIHMLESLQNYLVAKKKEHTLKQKKLMERIRKLKKFEN